MTSRSLAERAQALRQEFDRGFAAPPRAERAVHEDLLSLRIGNEPCALRLAEIAGLFADKPIMRVPCSVDTLIGVAGFRGALIAVHDLHALRGHARCTAPRWLVTLKGGPMALAFEQYEGHVRAAPDDFAEGSAAFVRVDGTTRSLIRVSSLLPTIRGPAASATLTKDP
jgi:purine-binding chemotaxis protein CheW